MWPTPLYYRYDVLLARLRAAPASRVAPSAAAQAAGSDKDHQWQGDSTGNHPPASMATALSPPPHWKPVLGAAAPALAGAVARAVTVLAVAPLELIRTWQQAGVAGPAGVCIWVSTYGGKLNTQL